MKSRNNSQHVWRGKKISSTPITAEDKDDAKPDVMHNNGFTCSFDWLVNQ